MTESRGAYLVDMTERDYPAVTGDGSGVALPEVVDGMPEWPAVAVTSNAPDRDQAIRALFEELLEEILSYADTGLFGPKAAATCAREATDYRNRLDALLAARG